MKRTPRTLTSQFLVPPSRRVHIFVALVMLMMLPCSYSSSFGQSPENRRSIVKIEPAFGGYVLIRNGSPYFIQGAGGWTHLRELKAAGGDSIRTWGVPTDNVLDEARRLGLTVTFGIWLGHKTEGFDYHNPGEVRKQFLEAERTVREFKNDPELLIWGVGNEMETGENPANGWADHAVWDAVEQIARMIRRIDPYHPVITVVAEFDRAKIAAIRKYCPSLDALGLNSYGSLATVPIRLKEDGWHKPYIITEAGPRGPWETLKTSWGAPVEPSSSSKAYDYLAGFQAAVESQKKWCLGGYMYFWGVEPNVVTTHTWFASFLPGGGHLAAVDAMTLLWTGRVARNRSPEILAWGTDAAMSKVDPGSIHHAFVESIDPDGDPLNVQWEIRKEATALSGPIPPSVSTIMKQRGTELEYSAPKESGAYRLFVYVVNGKGAAATANSPFFVQKVVNSRSPE